jgi:pimeloyl-ACP methyl ester carboxylesterase
VVIGQSLGGTLALALAATASCSAAVAINPVAPDPDGLEGLQWRRSRGHEWVDAPAPSAGETAYLRLPIAALVEMSRGALSTDLTAITQPVLLVTSADDDVVDPASADQIAAMLGGPVHRVLLRGAGHVATLDPRGRPELLAAITTFLAAVT